MTKGNKLAYKFFRIIFKPLLYILYHPTIIGRENIPATGKLVIAGNHMHAFDPILVDVSTKRIVCTLAKKLCTMANSAFSSAPSVPFPWTWRMIVLHL